MGPQTTKALPQVTSRLTSYNYFTDRGQLYSYTFVLLLSEYLRIWNIWYSFLSFSGVQKFENQAKEGYSQLLWIPVRFSKLLFFYSFLPCLKLIFLRTRFFILPTNPCSLFLFFNNLFLLLETPHSFILVHAISSHFTIINTNRIMPVSWQWESVSVLYIAGGWETSTRER